MKIVKINNRMSEDIAWTDLCQQQNFKSIINEKSIDYKLIAKGIGSRTNFQRRQFELLPCKFDVFLRNSSVIHSIQMSENVFFAHENPYVKNFFSLNDRVSWSLKNEKIIFSAVGENLAYFPIYNIKGEVFVTSDFFGGRNFMTASGKKIVPYTYQQFSIEVVKGWFNSPGHRKNLLNRDFEYHGYGITIGEKTAHNVTIPYFYVTQNFGSKKLTKNPLLSTTKKNIRIIKK